MIGQGRRQTRIWLWKDEREAASKTRAAEGGGKEKGGRGRGRSSAQYVKKKPKPAVCVLQNSPKEGAGSSGVAPIFPPPSFVCFLDFQAAANSKSAGSAALHSHLRYEENPVF